MDVTGQLQGTADVLNFRGIKKGIRLLSYSKPQPQRVKAKERARVHTRAPFAADPLRLGFTNVAIATFNQKTLCP